MREVLDRLDRLEKKQASMEEELKAKDARIGELEAELKKAKPPGEAVETKVTARPPPPSVSTDLSTPGDGPAPIPKVAAEPTLAGPSPAPLPEPWEYEPGNGYRVFTTKWGEMNIGLYSYARYLNQLATDDSYTDSFGRTLDINPRNDIQLAKVQTKFSGWLGTPKFRYYLWVWTSNANMGQGAQVVLGGTLSGRFHERFNLGAGITALPTTRSTRGNFPYWLRVDARPIADEYFRGSYTTGVYIWGDLTDNLHYKSMLGNNLSQLGIDAGQLDNAFQTVSTALWWTSDNYPAYAGYGDFEEHEKPAYSFGGAYTRSRESRQSQPGTEDPENTQLRISDGVGIFQPDAFAPGTQIDEATYQMTALDTSLKYRGFSFDFDYYFRWINNLASDEALPVKNLFDHGFDMQASYMIVPRLFQVYAFGSKIFGQYGKPWEVGGGFNVFPLKNRAMRFNIEADYVNHSPVGYLAYPSQVGMTGPIFMTNFELNL
ncbi:MAG TPA: hypothetical protein VJP40_03350 [bacterium]|nr:hypothetical protein [bacterium]